jgi:hypothetical protein
MPQDWVSSQVHEALPTAFRRRLLLATALCCQQNALESRKMRRQGYFMPSAMKVKSRVLVDNFSTQQAMQRACVMVTFMDVILLDVTLS